MAGKKPTIKDMADRNLTATRAFVRGFIHDNPSAYYVMDIAFLKGESSQKSSQQREYYTIENQYSFVFGTKRGRRYFN